MAAPTNGPPAPPAAGPPGERWSLATPALVLALAAFALLWESLVGGRLLVQLDGLWAYGPWLDAAPAGAVPQNELLADQSLVVHPFRHYFRGRLAEGELPLWNPHNYGGQPIAAAVTGYLWWPPGWPRLALGLRAEGWFAWGRLVVAGLGVLLFLRRLGLARAPATYAAVAFSLCGWMVTWLGHPHSQAALLLPYLFWWVEGATGARGGPSRRAGIATVAWGGVLFGLALVAGHLQTAVHVACAAALYALFRCLIAIDGRRLDGRALVALAAGALLGAGVAGVQLVPFLEYLETSQGRAADTRSLVAPVAIGEAAWFLVDPLRFGGPHHHDYTGPSGPHLNYAELVGGFAGRLTLVLAAIGAVLRWRDPRVRFLAAWIAGALLVAWQVSPVYEAFLELPVLGRAKPMRLLLWVALGSALLAGIGLDALFVRWSWGARRKRLFAAAAIAVVVGELLVVGRGFNPDVDPKELPLAQPLAALEHLERAPEPGRVVSLDTSVLPPNTNLFYGLDLLNGYDSIEPRAWVELVRGLSSDERGALYLKEVRYFDRLLPIAHALNVRWILTRDELPPPFELVEEEPVRLYRNPHALPRAFLARRVVVVEGAQERLARLHAEDFDPWTAVLEERPSDPLFAQLEEGPAAAGSVTLEAYEAQRVELGTELERAALLVLADNHAPGWKAWVDGEPVPILRVDHALRGVLVGAGSHRVRFEYRPRSFTAGAFLSLVSLLGTALLAWRARGSFSPKGK